MSRYVFREKPVRGWFTEPKRGEYDEGKYEKGYAIINSAGFALNGVEPSMYLGLDLKSEIADHTPVAIYEPKDIRLLFEQFEIETFFPGDMIGRVVVTYRGGMINALGGQLTGFDVDKNLIPDKRKVA